LFRRHASEAGFFGVEQKKILHLIPPDWFYAETIVRYSGDDWKKVIWTSAQNKFSAHRL
jgi:hypothetical protein